MSVCVVMPIHNAEKWLPETFASILAQTYAGKIILSVYDDASTDRSAEILAEFGGRFTTRGIDVVFGSGDVSGGVGFARNRAIAQSRSDYLCFLDADDVMLPRRIEAQVELAEQFPEALIGSRVVRDPPGSTERFTRWANTLTSDDLEQQIYTSHGPTILMPTWFCSRSAFAGVPGGFHESRHGAPEDLIFFYSHLDRAAPGKAVRRCDEVLTVYRHVLGSATCGVKAETILQLRLERLCRSILPMWERFTIWNAGKQGRRFYRSLSVEERWKVTAFCDVDAKKIAQKFYVCEDEVAKSMGKPRVPISPIDATLKPFIICVKLDLTGGAFEAKLASLDLIQTRDYVLFS